MGGISHLLVLLLTKFLPNVFSTTQIFFTWKKEKKISMEKRQHTSCIMNGELL